jgi:alpha-D-xyloside xylohydrolase
MINIDDNSFYLKTKNGTLRLTIMDCGIVRTSFSVDGVFDARQGKGMCYVQVEKDHEIIQGQNETIIDTKYILVRINEETGAVTYVDKKGKTFFSERRTCPRQLEKISLYKVADNESAVVEEIETADGIKKKIKAADKEEYGIAYKTRTYFEFEPEEMLIGFGQGENGEWNLRGSTYYIHQANRKIAIPMVVSTNNYGILLSTKSLALFSEKNGEAYIQTEADYYLDYYFIPGDTLPAVIKGFRKLTGRAAMLPKWAYGYIQSKERYKSQGEILDVAREFKKRKIGIDCIVLDWLSWEDGKWGQKSFDRSRFPSPKEMTDELHDMGIHFMMSIWPNMSPNTEDNKEFKEKNYLLPGTDIYDAFNEEARKLYFSQVERNLLPSGVDAFWCDSSEPITPEWEHHIEPEDGEKYCEFRTDAGNIMPLEMANSYGLYHAMTIWEGLICARPDKRVVNLTRSGWAGSQKYGTILWSGDVSASWDCLKRQVRAGLQMAASGMPYWTLDAGAFFVKRGFQWYWNGEYEGITDEYKKLYVRWLEFAAFLPIFRSHGTDVSREPWVFGDKGDQYYEAIVATIKGRYRLMPYIYSVGAAACLDDGMIIRPLFFDYPDEEGIREISDQYMFGPGLMICPVVSPKDTISIYLPAGNNWYDYYTGKFYEGGRRIEYECPIDRIAVFAVAGSIIPLAEEDGTIEKKVYPGKDASFNLYEDDGESYGYERGQYSITKLMWDDKQCKLDVEK